MKCLLVKVPSNMHVVLPPIGLGYLIGYLKNRNLSIDIKILDCLKEKYNHEVFRNHLIKENPDMVGFTAFTMEIESALKCAEITKRVNKNIITAIGGPHVSNVP